MAKGSFSAMEMNQGGTQVTFYFDNGQAETFSLPIPSPEFAQQLPQMLSQPWLTFHLIDQTVIVCTAKILKVELKPPVPAEAGEGSFPNSQRITTIHRGAVGRLRMNE